MLYCHLKKDISFHLVFGLDWSGGHSMLSHLFSVRMAKLESPDERKREQANFLIFSTLFLPKLKADNTINIK